MPIRRADSLLVAAVLLSAAPGTPGLAAQQQPPVERSWCLPADSGGARVWGTVYDSVSRQPLPLLVLQLQPSDERGEPIHNGWWARTDSLGRFCFRGVFVRPGRYRLTATHLPALGRRRPVPTHRDLRVDAPADTALSLPYHSLRALDSIATQGTRDSLLTVIRHQHGQWRARRPARYYYEAVPNCLCLGPDVTVIVDGDSAIGILDQKTGAERLDPAAQSFGTIDGLFDSLERDVRNQNNRRWSVAWDEQYGFPTHWEASAEIILIDAYGGFSVLHFEPAPR